MSNTLRNNVFAALCTLALLFAVAVTVEAQTDQPILEEDTVASIHQGDVLWVVPAADQPLLEGHLGQPATVESMSALLGRMPSANQDNAVRIEGGFPSPEVRHELEALGYRTETTLLNPALPGVGQAYLYTL